MRILAVSDVELGLLYNASVSERFKGIDIILSSGDLRYSYLEYLVSMLNVPLFYVLGNHANQIEHTVAGPKRAPDGGVNLHMRSIRYQQLLMAGIEGCLQYNNGPYQYTQSEMWTKAFMVVPKLLFNKIRFGRYLDVLVTHAPPWKIHDQDDRPHVGIKAFLWMDKVFQPIYHIHGHIHVYRNDVITKTLLGKTSIQNVYGYREITIIPGAKEK